MNLNKILRLHVRDVTFECPRKAVLSILSELHDIRPSFEENQYTITGKICHNILQEVLRNQFNLVNYYYIREGKNIEESIESALYDVFTPWKEIIQLEKEYYPWKGNLSMQQYILDNVEETIPKLANLAKSVISITKEKTLVSRVIGTEFPVQVKLYENIYVFGKIDILSWGTANEVHVIELKTGTKSKSDENQVLFYSEVIKTNFPELNVVPERWRTKNLKKGKIDTFEPINKNKYQHDRAKLLVQQALNMKSKSDLPPPDLTKECNSYMCYTCKYIVPRLWYII